MTRRPPFRVGYGYDVHALATGYNLWLGGIRIDHVVGLVGHSDADVLIHAICDALLGALALGDIGQYFPPTDPAYKGIDSKILLSRVCDLVRSAGYNIGNVDATIVAECPKLAPHIDAMRTSLSAVMGICKDCVSVKATTSERLGFTGREEGIAAHATVLVFAIDKTMAIEA